MKPMSIVTLTTDFGTEDHFVAAVKGVLLSRAPDAVIVDISHCIPPWNIQKALAVLQESVFCFPPGTLHVVVVDPTVGSDRKILYVKSRFHSFLAPDNGVLSFLPLSEIEEAREVLSDPGISRTFHGRDVFAPVAGDLLAGTAHRHLGQRLDPASLVRVQRPEPTLFPGGARGEIVDIDRFGNLISNIDRSCIQRSCLRNADRVSVSVAGRSAGRIRERYSDAPVRGVVALFNGSGLLEIACNEGNAQRALNAWQGAPVVCSETPDDSAGTGPASFLRRFFSPRNFQSKKRNRP